VKSNSRGKVNSTNTVSITNEYRRINTPFFLSRQEKKEISAADPGSGHPKSARFLPTRPILRLPTGQSCQISGTRHTDYLPLLLLAAMCWAG
jgi:hypothetical protein